MKTLKLIRPDRGRENAGSRDHMQKERGDTIFFIHILAFLDIGSIPL